MLEWEEICLKKDKLESKMNPWRKAEELEGLGCVEERESDGLMILQVCYGISIRRNSVWKN